MGIFLVAVFGLLIEDAERRDEIVTWVVDTLRLSPAGSVRLDEAIAGLASPTSALGLIALFGVLWAASGMMAAIRIALTSVERGAEAGVAREGVRPVARPPRRNPSPRRLRPDPDRSDRREHGQPSRLGTRLEALGSTAGDLAQALLSVAVVSATVLLLYRYVPPARPRWADLWMPALLAALAIQVTELGFGFYLSRFADTTSSTVRSGP